MNVRFVTTKGDLITAQAGQGARLLEVAQAAGMPLEGTCEGQMACSTCHVIVSPDWFEKLSPASADEEDMLDLAAGVTRTSRLACQIELSGELDGLTVKIPTIARDMQFGGQDGRGRSSRAGPGTIPDHAVTGAFTASIKALLNAGMSSGLRLVMNWPSIATS